MKEKNILFLDFDGVLNSVEFFLTERLDYFKDNSFLRDLDTSKLKVLNYILDNTPGLEIIVSSAWGHYFSLEEIKEGLYLAGLKREYQEKLIGITPKKMSSYRCNEVLWAIGELEEEGYTVSKWLTVDDHDIFPNYEDYEQCQGHELKTNSLTGLTVKDAWSIIRYFNKDFKKPTVFL